MPQVVIRYKNTKPLPSDLWYIINSISAKWPINFTGDLNQPERNIVVRTATKKDAEKVVKIAKQYKQATIAIYIEGY